MSANKNKWKPMTYQTQARLSAIGTIGAIAMLFVSDSIHDASVRVVAFALNLTAILILLEFMANRIVWDMATELREETGVPDIEPGPNRHFWTKAVLFSLIRGGPVFAGAWFRSTQVAATLNPLLKNLMPLRDINGVEFYSAGAYLGTAFRVRLMIGATDKIESFDFFFDAEEYKAPFSLSPATAAGRLSEMIQEERQRLKAIRAAVSEKETIKRQWDSGLSDEEKSRFEAIAEHKRYMSSDEQDYQAMMSVIGMFGRSMEALKREEFKTEDAKTIGEIGGAIYLVSLNARESGSQCKETALEQIWFLHGLFHRVAQGVPLTEEETGKINELRSLISETQNGKPN